MTHQPPRGTRDFLPEEMIKRQLVIGKIIATFEKWGFDPLDTPAFEEWGLLSKKGGQDIKNEIYYFKDKSNRELGLRFDFTVPFARVVSSNPSLPKPFRRYQVGPVWRYDRPGSGRYREFWQADIDVAGAPAGEADALCMAVACDALHEIGFKDFFIRINNRKIVESFLNSLGLDKKVIDIMRSIDKIEKIGAEGVKKELKEKKVDPALVGKIIDFIKTDSLDDVKNQMDNDLGKKGIEELELILGHIDALGFSRFVKFDCGMVRGLEYYTGPVFEASAGINLSVGGGGRYDFLIESFGGKPTPAVGISLGVDRLMLAAEEKKLLAAEKTKSRIYVAPVTDSVIGEAIKLTRKLVSAGVPTEFDLMRRSLSKELDYASAKGIPFVVVLGEKELKAGRAKLRNMKTGQETEFSIGDVDEAKRIVESDK